MEDGTSDLAPESLMRAQFQYWNEIQSNMELLSAQYWNEVQSNKE